VPIQNQEVGVAESLEQIDSSVIRARTPQNNLVPQAEMVMNAVQEEEQKSQTLLE